MPVYVYRCASCNAETEKRQSFSDASLTTCESCGGTVRRVLHAVGVIFKGSGFYSTDNRNGRNGKPTTDGSESGEKSTGAESAGDGATSKASGGESTGGTSKSEGGEKPSAPATPAASGTKSE